MCILQTKIFHPNIKNDHISLDRLKENWCISMSIRTLILSIISFLDDPNPNNPLDMECAYVYLENRDTYN
jgi:ubiquitin-protein ligase